MLGATMLGATILAGVLLTGPPTGVVDWVAERHPGCLYRLSVAAPLVALTIDDGPDPATTPAILDELRRYGARATFFVITERLEGRAALVRRMVAEGHELGNHFTRDRPGIRLGAEEFAQDLGRAHEALAPYGAVRWARPGAGWYTRRMVATMAEQGYLCALGSVYPYDAEIPSAAFAGRHVLRNVRPGAIVVLHDGGARGKRTARILDTVLPELQRRGFRIVTLSELAAAAGSDSAGK